MGFAEWYNLANGFLTMQEFKSAANAYRRALKLNPGYGPAWNNLGTLEGMLGNNSAALDDYKRAAGLGDPLGDSNFSRLQNAINAAQEARSDDPLKALWRSQAADLEYRARQAWQERLARAQG
jgi:tetratricopeptide (TPR) repeat protein